MTIKRKICPPGLKNNPNKPLAAINAVTIHTTGNRALSAAAGMHADYQFGGSGGREASWHYTVDDVEIWQSFEDGQMCWHAGNKAGNEQSIGVEICVNKGARGFAIACKNAAWLVAELLTKHNLSIQAVKQHYNWSGKNCPAELRSGEWGVDWEGFLKMIQDAITEIKNTPSDWAKEAWEWAVANKITDGAEPKGAATREMAATMIYRAQGLK
jgi:N-acetylmuramoyl-L-alanine amidase